ncbi:hypothetical protein NP233_g9462 [Leucocoprinus birnbaumii]|uniref:Uncharacterized protein n=1 Tax=Leucocoprinus birnbaumii TaxID=56174 RepID=A0AAD5YM76_9AGAR|nr:hypothetical protein NP233_g9462 [Leucocoprinus birnbaumii]
MSTQAQLFEGLCDGLTSHDIKKQQQSKAVSQVGQIKNGDNNTVIPVHGAARLNRAFEVEDGNRNLIVGPDGPQSNCTYEDAYKVGKGSGNAIIPTSRPDLVNQAIDDFFRKAQNEAPIPNCDKHRSDYW